MSAARKEPWGEGDQFEAEREVEVSEAARVNELLAALRRIERWADEAEEGWYVGGIAAEALEAWERDAEAAPPPAPPARA